MRDNGQVQQYFQSQVKEESQQYFDSMSFHIKPTSAVLFRDTQIFSSMDPYVVIRAGSSIMKTVPHKEGGKNPRWKDILTLSTNSDSMLVSVFDKDLITDDQIGTGNVSLARFRNSSSQEIEQRLDLSYKGKKSGVLKLLIKYESNSPQINSWGNQNGNGWQNMGNTDNGWGSKGCHTQPYQQDQSRLEHPFSVITNLAPSQQPSSWGQDSSNWGENRNMGGWGNDNNGW